MGLDRLRTLLAAPLASLFLILSLSAFGGRTPPSYGFLIPVIQLHHEPQEPTDCGGRSEFIRLTKDGKTWINEDEFPPAQIAPAIASMMESRAERVVYVVVDSELSYWQFAGFLDQIQGATSDLHVVLVSGVVRREFETSHDLCDFVVPVQASSEFPGALRPPPHVLY